MKVQPPENFQMHIKNEQTCNTPQLESSCYLDLVQAAL